MSLPNFLVIGAAKAGTTSLYHYLRQHPDVYMSPVKEPRYYCAEGEADGITPRLTRESYRRLFDGVTSERAVGEASPQYLNGASAAARIAADIPAARLVVSLRNPADRAFSSYLGRLRDARERCGLDAAMRPGTYYFETSLYHPRLARYFARFDRRRIKVIIFEEWVAAPARILRELFEFLEVDPDFPASVAERHNPALVPRSLVANQMFCGTVRLAHKFLPGRMLGSGVAGHAQRRFLLRPPDRLPDATRRRLLDQFADDVAKTGALVERDLSPWLR